MKKYLIPLMFIIVSVLLASCSSSELVYSGPHSITGASESGNNSGDTAPDGSAIKPGIEVGSITSINYNTHEAVVHQKKVIDMGSSVYVIADNREIVMTVSFPMMSSFKCVVAPKQRKYSNSIKKGMTVYIKN